MGGQRSLQDLHSRKGIQRPFLHNGNSQRRVSEAGHSRRFRHLHLMSAFAQQRKCPAIEQIVGRVILLRWDKAR